MGHPALALYGNVGPVSGSIRHDGDVRILGSVSPGYRVTASGNVFVTGNVRGAKVHAGGGIAVNGIVGPNALLDAVGAVSIMQVTDAKVLAGLDIEIRTAAERTDLAAGRRILFTGPPGLLRGGSAIAGIGLEAERIECAGGRRPRLRLGLDPFAETPAVLEERLELARRCVKESVDPEAEDYRHRVATIAAAHVLRGSLEMKLARMARAEDRKGTPYLKVTGTGTVRADIRLGDNQLELEAGPLMVVLDNDAGGATQLPLEEAARAE